MPHYYCATPCIIERGLMHPMKRNQEPCFTDTGLLSLVAQIAYANDEAFDIETKLTASSTFQRILLTAVAGGFKSASYAEIRQLFSDGVSPSDEDAHGERLAMLCRQLARAVPPGQILRIIAGGN